MVLKSRHETRDTNNETRDTRHETIRYDSVNAFICFRIFTENFDYNLRFLILIVPYDSLPCISEVQPYSTVPHVVPRAFYLYEYEYKWAAAGAYER